MLPPGCHLTSVTVLIITASGFHDGVKRFGKMEFLGSCVGGLGPVAIGLLRFIVIAAGALLLARSTDALAVVRLVYGPHLMVGTPVVRFVLDNFLVLFASGRRGGHPFGTFSLAFLAFAVALAFALLILAVFVAVFATTTSLLLEGPELGGESNNLLFVWRKFVPLTMTFTVCVEVEC